MNRNSILKSAVLVLGIVLAPVAIMTMGVWLPIAGPFMLVLLGVIGVPILTILMIRDSSRKEELMQRIKQIRKRVSEVQIEQRDLSGENLSGITLTKANVAGHDLSGADISDANLSKAKAIGARFFNTNLKDSNLSEAKLQDSTMVGANLEGVDLSGANLEGAVLKKVRTENTNWEDAIFSHRTILPFSHQEALNKGMILAS